MLAMALFKASIFALIFSAPQTVFSQNTLRSTTFDISGLTIVSPSEADATSTDNTTINCEFSRLYSSNKSPFTLAHLRGFWPILPDKPDLVDRFDSQLR